MLASVPIRTTAQNTINIIVPSTAGGGPDLVARLVAQVLRTGLNTEVVVNNVPGANGKLALQRFANATPESNSLLVSQDSVLVINPWLYGDNECVPWRLGRPVAYLGSNDNYVLVRADHSANTLAELLGAHRKSSPHLTYGTGGIGSLAHILGMALGQESGASMLHVPYKSNSEAVMGLLRGDVEMIISGSAALPMLRAQRLKALAVTGAENSRLYPKLPRVNQTYPDLAFSPWFGLLAHPSATSAFVHHVEMAVQQGLQSPSIQQTLLQQGGIAAQFRKPAEFQKVLEQDCDRYGKMAIKLNTPSSKPRGIEQ